MKRFVATLALVLGLVLSFSALADGDFVRSGTATAVGATSYTLPSGSKWAEVHVWGDSANFTVKVFRKVTPDAPAVQVGADIVNPDATGKNYGGPAGEVVTVQVSAYVGGTVYWRVVAR